MPRVARKLSDTKVYHIILRGNDKQDIFYDEQDYEKFLKEMIRTKEKYVYDLYAYCLMPNHVHLTIYDKENQISRIIQSIAVSYSSYFAKKYDKVGHLFQNRFLSKNIETRKYLLELCRYIHQNPIKAGISEMIDYRWSSYKEFIEGDKIISSDFIFSIFGDKKLNAMNNFIAFHNNNLEKINDEVEYEILEKLTDEQLSKRIKMILGLEDIRKVRTYNAKIRNDEIKKLKGIKGTSKSQIARVLGINRKIIERIMK